MGELPSLALLCGCSGESQRNFKKRVDPRPNSRYTVRTMKTEIKIRKSWGNTNPVTKKIESKKAYSRKNKWGNKWD